MNIQRVCAAYFSATGTTQTVIRRVAGTMAEELGCPLELFDFTSPDVREKGLSFQSGDVVVVGVPTYAGKTPNKVLPFLKEGMAGNGALAVPVVTFGNRSFDNALAELCAVMEGSGFHTISAGAFSCRHSFSDKLAFGRPDAEDLEQCDVLARGTAEQIRKMTEIPAPIVVDGDPDAPYYTPKGLDGEPVKFLKAKSQCNTELCVKCGKCAKVCPMGSIDPDDPANVPGICIKCQSCIRNCKKDARFFDDEAFLSHVAMLEQNYAEGRRQNRLYLLQELDGE